MISKTILITGATDGIGRTTAINLANMGHSIIVHGRNKNRCEEVIDEISIKTKNDNCTFEVGDLSSFEEIYNLSDSIHSKYEKIDTLLNNAGIFMNDRHISADGFEMTFGVNHLSVFLLTHLLFDLIKNSDDGRIVTVSSLANVRGKIDLNYLNGENVYESYKAYSQSKLANILFAFELADKIKKYNITSNALHPGVITTKLLKTGFNISGSSTEDGAKTSIHLSVSDEVKDVSGKYFDKMKFASYNPLADNKKLRSDLWNISEKFTKINSATFLK